MTLDEEIYLEIIVTCNLELEHQHVGLDSAQMTLKGLELQRCSSLQLITCTMFTFRRYESRYVKKIINPKLTISLVCRSCSSLTANAIQRQELNSDDSLSTCNRSVKVQIFN